MLLINKQLTLLMRFLLAALSTAVTRLFARFGTGCKCFVSTRSLPQVNALGNGIQGQFEEVGKLANAYIEPLPTCQPGPVRLPDARRKKAGCRCSFPCGRLLAVSLLVPRKCLLRGKLLAAGIAGESGTGNRQYRAGSRGNSLPAFRPFACCLFALYFGWFCHGCFLLLCLHFQDVIHYRDVEPVALHPHGTHNGVLQMRIVLCLLVLLVVAAQDVEAEFKQVHRAPPSIYAAGLGTSFCRTPQSQV